MPRYGAVVEVIKTWKFNTFKSRALKFNRIFLPHKKKKKCSSFHTENQWTADSSLSISGMLSRKKKKQKKKSNTCVKQELIPA